MDEHTARPAEPRACGREPALALATLAALTMTAAPGLAQSLELQVVIAADTPCLARPDVSAPTVRHRGLGERFQPHETRRTDRGTWLLDRTLPANEPAGCWIAQSRTRAWADREAALVAAADWILERTDDPLFKALVAVDNFLLQTPDREGASTAFERFPLVQLRRLEVVHQATGAPDAWLVPVREDPLKSAWFFANRDVLSYHEPAGRWVVEAEAFWRLYDAHRHTQWAEEIAWTAARGMLVQAECHGPCRLEGVLMTFARYWTEFPAGLWVGEALDRAAAAVRSSATWCEWTGPEEARKLAERVRSTLEGVRSPGVDRLLHQVETVVEACAAVPRLADGPR